MSWIVFFRGIGGPDPAWGPDPPSADTLIKEGLLKDCSGRGNQGIFKYLEGYI